jgi:hypothetical protein
MVVQNGRVIVDLCLTPPECAAVREALKLFENFEYCGFHAFSTRAEIQECDIFYAPIEFSLNPQIAGDECIAATVSIPRPMRDSTSDFTAAPKPVVLCVCELFGVAFSQGVNEMQTLANMSSAKDVQRQVDLNMTSMQRTT